MAASVSCPIRSYWSVWLVGLGALLALLGATVTAAAQEPPTLDVVLTDPGGNDISNSQVIVGRLEDDGDYPHVVTETQYSWPPEGGGALSVSLEDTAARYRIRVIPPDVMRGTLPFFSREFERAEDGTITDLMEPQGVINDALELAFPADAVRLEVRDTDGALVPGSGSLEASLDKVHDVGQWVDYEWMGSYRLSSGGDLLVSLEPGTYRLALDADLPDRLGLDEEFTVEEADTGATVPLALPAIDVAGTVSLDGTGVGSADIDVYNKRDGYWDYLRHVGADEEGRFALSLPEDGPYRLRVASPPGTLAPNFFYEFSHPGDTEQSLELAFPDPVLHLLLVDAQGEPVSGADIILRIDDVGYWAHTDLSAATNDSGQAVFALGEGRYQINVTPRSDAMPPFTYEVEFGADGVLRGDGHELDAEGRLVLQVPEANLHGTLYLDAGQHEPADWATIDVQRQVEDDFGTWWDSAGLWTQTDDEGRFALSLDDGEYRVVFSPPYDSAAVPLQRRVTVTGGVAKQPDGTDINLPWELSFPTPNLEVTLSGGETQFAHANVEMWASDGDFEYWDWAGLSGTADAEGVLRFVVDQPGEYRLRIGSPQQDPSLPSFSWEFTVEADGNVVGGPAFAVPYPVPNFTGQLLDGDQAVSGAWLDIEVWTEDGDFAYWDWTDTYARTDNDGRFALNLPVDGQYRVRAQPRWGDASLVPFSATFNLNGDTLTLDAGQEAIAQLSDGDILLTFPQPNLNLRILDGSTAVRDAWIQAQEWDQEGQYWRWLDVYGSTNSDGEVAFQLPADSDTTYRLQVNPPWDSATLPPFDIEVQVTNGVLLIDGVSDVGTVDVSFPAPNLELRVRADGQAVRYAGVQIQRKHDDGWWEFTDHFVSTPASGSVRFLLEPGTYRAWVSPPWNNSDLPSFATGEFIIADGQDSSVATVDAAFPETNLTGTLYLSYTDADNNSPSRWGWVEVVKGDVWQEGFPIRRDGSFAHALDDGDYTLVLHPGNGTRSPLHVSVTVSGGELASWSYAGGANQCPSDPTPCSVAASFDEVTDNLSGTVQNGDTTIAGAFVTATAGNVEVTAVSDDEGDFGLVLPDGTADVMLTVIIVNEEVGDATTYQFPDQGLGLDLTLDLGTVNN